MKELALVLSKKWNKIEFVLKIPQNVQYEKKKRNNQLIIKF